MLILGVLLVLLGTSSAIDLTGCRPNPPQVIDALWKLKGDLYSPGYKEGQNYPNDAICQLTIRAPFGFRIKLEFIDLDIEVADMCMRDAVEIADLSGRHPIGLGVFCGNQTYPPIISVGNTVAITFRSDFMVGRKGYHIRYTASGTSRLCPIGQSICRNRKCFTYSQKCDGHDDCGDGTDEENCRYPLPTTECGIRKSSGSFGYDRVVGGREAEPGSWPWQVDMQVSFIYPNGHNCGGTLISAQWVLTAAHCFMQFKQPEAWRIHVGNHNKFKADDGEQIRMVERIIVFPGVTGNQLLRLLDVDMQNDIALMKLNAPVKFSDTVRPACLPTQGYEIPLGTNCMASGWGMTRGTGTSNALKEVELTIQDGEKCNGQMGPINRDTMICVKNSKGFQDVCHGDSGGPLVCELNKKWHVLGATSFGSEGNFEGGLCALPGSATIYSKASHKINWIMQQIRMYS